MTIAAQKSISKIRRPFYRGCSGFFGFGGVAVPNFLGKLCSVLLN
ncbi:hypothetical protein J2Z66_003181 [Paenibacillus eucommiae]|uniref:Uncharacterized protein n=1 Tax=Paenibacillus eucommiae TaxID=1355755 RepID=A0ABS4IYF8_9BACL|nr:hypothetical protein [Paenibacillus eucommiae]